MVTTRILSPTTEHLHLSAQHLIQGELVAIPTETVYGLAANALDPRAVIKVFEAKERPTFDPLIVHLAMPAPGNSWRVYLEQTLRLVDLSGFTDPAVEKLEQLLQHFWPGPLTVVLPKTSQVPDLVTSGLATVALRIPRHPVAQALLQLARIPLAAPSANRFGRISPTSASAVLSELAGRVAYILDGGVCEVGLESTVIRLDPTGQISLLRPGGISVDQLSVWGSVQLSDPSPQSSPGSLDSHYAPSKPCLLLPTTCIEMSLDQWQTIPLGSASSIGILAFAGEGERIRQAVIRQGWPGSVKVEVLSPQADLTEAAHRLFACLRILDESGVDLIVIEPCPTQTGLGFAIGDRIRRATAKR